MTIHKAIEIVATDDLARRLNPKCRPSMDLIADLIRRGDHRPAALIQAADNVAFHLSARETRDVMARAASIQGAR